MPSSSFVAVQIDEWIGTQRQRLPRLPLVRSEARHFGALGHHKISKASRPLNLHLLEGRSLN